MITENHRLYSQRWVERVSLKNSPTSRAIAPIAASISVLFKLRHQEVGNQPIPLIDLSITQPVAVREGGERREVVSLFRPPLGSY